MMTPILPDFRQKLQIFRSGGLAVRLLHHHPQPVGGPVGPPPERAKARRLEGALPCPGVRAARRRIPITERARARAALPGARVAPARRVPQDAPRPGRSPNRRIGTVRPRPSAPAHRAMLAGMSAAAFDTYAAAKRLRDAGFDEDQAEAAVSMVRDATAADRDQLATKADLATHRADTRADLASLERRLLGYGIALAGLLFAALKLF